MAVFRQEQEYQLRASVYSKDDVARNEANGIVKWLDSILNGDLEDRYVGTAQIDLDTIRESNSKDKKLEPSGTEWMAADGLD